MKKALRVVGAVLLAILLAAATYLAAVMGQPQRDQASREEQPLISASAAQAIAGEEQLDTLLQSFPIPALCCVPGSGYALEYGSSYDMAFEGGFARILQLNYVTAQGVRFSVSSIYPARALSLLEKEDYRISGEGPLVAGVRTVRMERAGGIRLHTQTAQGVYVVTLPRVEDDVLSRTLQPLQLLSASNR